MTAAFSPRALKLVHHVVLSMPAPTPPEKVLACGRSHGAAHAHAVVSAAACVRGRPPLRPFVRAAAALAGDERRPPMRPSSAIQVELSNTDDTN